MTTTLYAQSWELIRKGDLAGLRALVHSIPESPDDKAIRLFELHMWRLMQPVFRPEWEGGGVKR